MLKIETRPLTAKERNDLQSTIKDLRMVFKFKKPAQSFLIGFIYLFLLAFVGFLAGTFIVTVLYFLSKLIPVLAPLSVPSSVKMFQAGGAILATIGIPIWIWTSSRIATSNRQKLIEKDLKTGQAEILHVSTHQVVHHELNGEEQLFFIDLGNSKTLFLTGEYLLKSYLSHEFPNTDFQLVRGFHSKTIFKLICLGKPFQAKEMDLSDALVDDCCFPMDGDILDAKLDSLESDLKHLAKNRH